MSNDNQINKEGIGSKEEKEIAVKMREALIKFKAVYGDIKNLTLEEFMSLCDSSQYEMFENLNVIRKGKNEDMSYREVISRFLFMSEFFEMQDEEKWEK